MLDAPVVLEFSNIHIQDILSFISDTYDINFMLDQRVVQPNPASPDKAISKMPLGSPGYITDGYIPQISLTNVPLGEALLILLRPLDLTYSAQDGYIWVSSPDLLDQQPLPAEKVQPQSNGDPDKPNAGPKSPGFGGIGGGRATGVGGGMGGGFGGGVSVPAPEQGQQQSRGGGTAATTAPEQR